MDLHNLMKALDSDSPEKELYALIPRDKRKEFIKFAKQFGIGEKELYRKIRKL